MLLHFPRHPLSDDNDPIYTPPPRVCSPSVLTTRNFYYFFFYFSLPLTDYHHVLPPTKKPFENQPCGTHAVFTNVNVCTLINRCRPIGELVFYILRPCSECLQMIHKKGRHRIFGRRIGKINDFKRRGDSSQVVRRLRVNSGPISRCTLRHFFFFLNRAFIRSSLLTGVSGLDRARFGYYRLTYMYISNIRFAIILSPCPAEPNFLFEYLL